MTDIFTSARNSPVLAFAAVLALFLHGCGGSGTGGESRENAAARDLGERGRVFFDAGDYSNAIERYTEAVRLLEEAPAESAPSLASFQFQLGDAHHRVGHRNESIAALRKARDAARIAFPANSIENIRAAVFLGRVLADAGENDEAVEVLTAARQLLPGGSTDPGFVLLDLVSLEAIADAHIAMNRGEEAAASLEKYLMACDAKLGFGHLRTGMSLAKAAGYFSSAGRFDLAMQLHEKAVRSLGQALGENDPIVGDQLVLLGWLAFDHLLATDDAYEFFARALEIYGSREELSPERLFRALDGTTTVRQGVWETPEEQAEYAESLGLATEIYGANSAQKIKAQAIFAISLRDKDERAAAREELNALVALRGERKEMREGAYNEAFDFVGIALQYLGDTKTGVKILEENLRELQPKLGSGHPGFEKAALRLAWVYVRMGGLLEADKYFTHLYGNAAARLGEQHRRSGNLAFLLAETRRSASNYEDARKLYQSALGVHVAVHGPDHKKTSVVRHSLGIVLAELLRFDEATAMFRENLEIQRKTLGEMHSDCFLTEGNLAWVLYEQEDYFGSKELCLESLERAENLPDLDTYGRAELLHNLSRAHWALGEYESAANAAEKSFAIFSKILPATHPDISRSRVEIARAYTQINRGSEAERHLVAALDLAKGNHGEMSLPVANITRSLAILYARTGLYELADQKFEETIGIEKAIYGESSSQLIDVYTAYGDSLYERSKFGSAAEKFRIAIEIAGGADGLRFGAVLRPKTSLASAFARVGDTKDEARELLAEVRESLGADEVDAKPLEIFKARIAMAGAYRLLEESAEAEKEAQSAIVVAEAHPEIKESVVLAMVQLAVSAMDRKDLREAQVHGRVAVKLALDSGEHSARLAISAHEVLARAYQSDGKIDEAVEQAAMVYESAKLALGGKSPTVLHHLNSLSVMRFNAGQLKKATEGMIEAYLLARNIYGVDNVATDSYRANLATAHSESNRFEEALELYEESLAFREKHYGNQRETADLLDMMANTNLKLKEYPKAASYHRRIIAILVELDGDRSAGVAYHYKMLGNLYYKMANRPRALEYWEMSLNRYKSLGINNAGVVNLRNNLEALRKQFGG